MSNFDFKDQDFPDDPLDQVCTFGQYKDATYKEIADQDSNYARWLVEWADNVPEEVKEALDEYLG